MQDFPLYGAERRSAPVTAYTRISPQSILERGIITEPDVLIIGDDSLIEDPFGNPLYGTNTTTVIIINTAKPDLKERFDIKGRLALIDATGISLEIIGKGVTISAAMGAAACKIIGLIKRDTMEKNQSSSESRYQTQEKILTG